MTNSPDAENLIAKLLDRTKELIQLKKYEEAEHFLQQIENHKPQEVRVSFQRGMLHMQKEEYENAIDQFLIFYRSNPASFVTINNIAAAYFKLSKYFDALDYYKKALQINPDSDYVLDGIGAACLRCFHLAEGISYYKKAMEISYNQVRHSNVMLTMIYADTVTPEELYEEAREFGKRAASNFIDSKKFENDISAHRKIRIGYVSPDFRVHPVPYFLEPLLRGHDRENFEVYAYSNAVAVDHVTERIKSGVDHWRDIRNLADDTICDLIKHDKIDILVDVAGHTSFNKLGVFARRAAPVQVTWLGYTATTGVEAMDYRITDSHADPQGMTEKLNVETLWRLPKIFAAYAPHENSPDVIDHPPFEDNGYITFGCFNNFIKVRDPVLKTWAEILKAIPDARLMLEIENIEEEKFYYEVANRFTKAGLPLDRVIFEPRKKSNQYVLYNKIDIALDPFPGVGGTTSMDTLWMGVPFVTLAGKHFASRMGVSILSNTGLPELVGQSAEDYVYIAINLANDKERLRTIRHNLRERFAASPAMDSKAFTKDIEEAYRGMWEKYCDANF